jgi:hypothetical protein
MPLPQQETTDVPPDLDNILRLMRMQVSQTA